MDEDDGLWSTERAETALRRAGSLIDAAAGELAESGWHREAETMYLLTEEPPSRLKVARALATLEAPQLWRVMESVNILSAVAHERGMSDAVSVFADIFDFCKWVAGRKADDDAA